MNKQAAILLLAALLGLSQCKKKDPDPASQLPPATQTGANTFGCLVNGQAYTPKGNNGMSNLYVSYDSTFRGGALGIETYRLEGGGLTKYL
ncbi:Riean_0653 family protein [Hymenobacter ruber]